MDSVIQYKPENRITSLLRSERRGNILSIYFTAGYPHLQDTLRLASALEKAGAEMLEIGIPYSDPVADGPIIQASSAKAIENGMNLKLLFQQLETLRDKVQIPVLLMGYFNNVLQYGLIEFCKACAAVGIDGCIIPDLPFEVYQKEYRDCFEQYGIKLVWLIAPQTAEQRVRMLDKSGAGFLYLLSSTATTGGAMQASEASEMYLKKIKSMELKSPTMIGFGINNQASFSYACNYADGAIVGSAFVASLGTGFNDQSIHEFIQNIKGQ